ncbi:PLC-like phosphodiesterase [Limtongia smithiae]|uniref:PLC-like phosphodiesterase n=1 Tax=Limtongia smithiae TaxID=1125753 RepID=UPI0034CFFD3E
METLDTTTTAAALLLDAHAPRFCGRRADRNGVQRTLPQVVGHRGYPAKYAENTIAGFIAAVEAGADGIETDVHVSADNIVVISHDPHTKRVFGSDTGPIATRKYYGDLDALRTLKEPHSPMPLLRDVLELFVSNPLFASKWLCIDVKAENGVDVIEAVAKTMKDVKDDMDFWETRVVLGIWLTKFLPKVMQFLPTIPIMHIGADAVYARQFLDYPTIVGFSLLTISLYSRDGYTLIRDARAAHKGIYAWTVRDDESMRLCAALQLDAVLADDSAACFRVLEQDVHTLGANPERDAELVLSLGTKTKYYVLGAILRLAMPFIRRRFE